MRARRTTARARICFRIRGENCIRKTHLGVWYAYIARQSDGRFYVGISQLSVPALLRQHAQGRHARHTASRRLLRVEWTEHHPALDAARRREIQLKKWSHAKKQALIDGDMARLKELSRCRQHRGRTF